MQKIAIDDFSKVLSLSEVRYAPDGKRAAFVVNQPLVGENKYRNNIWVLEDGAVRKLTGGGSESRFVWLDNETILFPGDRKKAHKPAPGGACTVFNRINVHGGEAEELFTVPLAVTAIRPLGGTEYLLLAVYDHNAVDLTGLTGAEREEAVARIEEERDYEVFDELPFWFNGRGVINKRRVRLYRFDSADGTLEALSPEFMNVTSFDYDAERDRVLYHGVEFQWVDDRRDDLYVRGLHSGETVQVKLDKRYSVSAAAFMGDKVILAATDEARYGTSENPALYLADPETGALTALCDPDEGFYSTVSTDCRQGGGQDRKATAEGWYCTVTRRFSSHVVRFAPDGTETLVTPDVGGSVDCFDLAGEEVLYVAMRENGLQELYTCRVGGEERRLTHFNDDYLATHAVSPVKHFAFLDRDGVELDGWVMEPVGCDPQRTYPAILNVHGGPKGLYSGIFFHEMQFWASEGYFVFFCNPRGSDGRGNEFADIRGKRYGVLDYNDIMDFTDAVLAKYPQIDPKRVGMAGGSYGGFMANWIVGHTDRFAAVASQRSISNYFSKCLTTDIGYYHNLSAVQADPWNNPEDMWERSPLKYADRCKTPTLFIQSDEDYRCWMADAIQMFTALRMHGVPTRLCLFHGENHGLSRTGKPKHRIRRLREITSWFDQYLK